MNMSVLGASAVLIGATLFAASAAPARAEDRVFISDRIGMSVFSGQAVWTIAARCTSHYQDTDAAITRYRDTRAAARARYPELASELGNDPAFEARLVSGYQDQARHFRAAGLQVINRDRPGSGPAVFEARVAEYLEAQRLEPMDDRQADKFDAACRSYLFEIEQRGFVR